VSVGVGVGIRRKPGETWRACAVRYARSWSLGQEVAEMFDAAVGRGVSDEEAAVHACIEWDVAEVLVEDDE
jgi:hypothetical protein